MPSLDAFTNQYALSKTLRFELKPINKAAKNSKNILQEQKKERGDEMLLVKQLKKIQGAFLDLFVYAYHLQQDESDEQAEYLKLQNNWEIHYDFLRKNIKNKFYNWEGKNDKDKQYELVKIDFLPAEILRWLKEWQEIISKMEEYTEAKEESQKRRRDIAFCIRQLLAKHNFWFVRDFVRAIRPRNKKEIDDAVQEFKKYIEETEKNLKACEKKFLPSQSAGVILHKATLNYYTLNKTPKEYGNLQEDKKKELERKIIDWKNKYGKSEFFFDRKFQFEENPLYWTLDEAYQKIKQWKADQKSSFNEEIGNYISDYLQKGFQEEKINEKVILEAKQILDEFALFTPLEKKYFKDFLENTKEIKILSNEKNTILQRNGDIKAKDFEKHISDKKKKEQELTEDEKRFEELQGKIKEKAKKRGAFFNKPGEKTQTQNYKDICELYKRIAMKRGNILAEIASLEDEKVESQLLTHWAFILQKGEKYFTIFAPKDGENFYPNKEKNILGAKRYVEEKFSEGRSGENTLYHFKSLTFRALEKLCFKKEKNSFFQCVKKTDPNIYFPRYKEEWRNNEQKLICFYQQILKSKYAKKYLDLVDFGGLENFLNKTDFQNIQEFESELEKVCYIKVPLAVSDTELEKFLKTYNASQFEITSQDLRIKQEKTLENHQEKRHTEIWRDFWKNENEEKYATRINPQMGILYREADEKLQEKIQSGEIQAGKKLQKFRNRFADEHFTLQTTVTLNATDKKTQLAFKTTEEIQKHVEDFNEKFNNNFTGEWVYGIDRGLKELATLNVVKFSDEKNEVGVSEPKEFAKITAWKLKKEYENEILSDKNGIERKIINNISYFVDQEELFEKLEVSSIDLTEAKLVKGKIILNGDRNTYLKLKELSAKRRIFELWSYSKIDKDSQIKITKEKIHIYCNDGVREIYNWKDFEKNNQKHKNKIKEELERYLKSIDGKNKFFDEEQVQKINHLRDAITANMIGILNYLQEEIGRGIMALENMDEKKKETFDVVVNGRFSDEETGEEIKYIDDHFARSNQDISRRLEWALYRKFQFSDDKENLVPPNIKQTILLKDDFTTYQFGILKYVKIGGTSSNCPNCGEKSGKSGDHFICKAENSCEFSSQENRDILEQNLNNSDEVAAYNVAKNGFENVYEKQTIKN